LAEIQSIRRLNSTDLVQKGFRYFLLEDFRGEPENLVEERGKCFRFAGSGLGIEEEIDALPCGRAKNLGHRLADGLTDQIVEAHRTHDLRTLGVCAGRDTVLSGGGGWNERNLSDLQPTNMAKTAMDAACR